jgi:hypothetical protein
VTIVIIAAVIAALVIGTTPATRTPNYRHGRARGHRRVKPVLERGERTVDERPVLIPHENRAAACTPLRLVPGPGPIAPGRLPLRIGHLALPRPDGYPRRIKL